MYLSTLQHSPQSPIDPKRWSIFEYHGMFNGFCLCTIVLSLNLSYAKLVALHSTPVSRSLTGWAEFTLDSLLFQTPSLLSAIPQSIIAHNLPKARCTSQIKPSVQSSSNLDSCIFFSDLIWTCAY